MYDVITIVNIAGRFATLHYTKFSFRMVSFTLTFLSSLFIYKYNA
jgi:hypothetical protein